MGFGNGLYIEEGSIIMALPPDLLKHVASYLDHESLHSMELTCRSFAFLDGGGEFWKQSVLRKVMLPLAADYRFVRSWKRFACEEWAMNDARHINMLEDVTGVSSIHRDEAESASNTLELSKCFRISVMLREEEAHHILNDNNIQRLICDCSEGECYWSSAPSNDNNSNDHIDYSLQQSGIISSIEIIPYRAYWQLGAPGYAPKHIRLSLLESATSPPYYISPEYPVKNVMELQVFTLPHKVLGRKGIVVRVTFVGKQQYEYETEMENVPQRFYCCISYVGVNGMFCDQ